MKLRRMGMSSLCMSTSPRTAAIKLQAKPQLIEVELLRTRAKPMTQQTLDQQQQLLVLGLQLRHHLPQHAL